MSRIYIVYDERAIHDVDRATVYIAGAESLEEAKEDAADFTPCVIYSYEQKGQMLIDEQLELHVQ